MPPFLAAHGITKRFPGVVALAGVGLSVEAGEVVSVIGENGAGKSTLMKILGGIYQPDEGGLSLDGKSVTLASSREATDLGIALIHQELNLLENLSVGANLFLGREAHRMGWLDRRRMHAEAEEILAHVGLDVSPRTPLRALAMGQQQLVEIAKALARAARVLIMDEPTSSLSPGEAEQLFILIEDLRGRGVSIIYVSHRLREVEQLSDRVVVLRDGQNAGALARDEIDHAAMVRMMVGRDVSRFYARTPHDVGEPVLTVSDFVSPAWPGHRLDFHVRSGEVVALAGLVGAGRTELLQALFGIDRPLGGRVEVGGEEVPPGDPSAAIEAGLALVPEDRKQQGLVLDFPVRYNLTLANLDANRGHGGLLAPHKEAAEAARMVDTLAIKTPSAMQRSRFLSGGNQQKVVLGKWLSRTPRVLLMDEPTRGIDIGAKQEIYRLIEALARDGMAILFASSEMEEVLGLADRVVVMQEGRITGSLLRDELSEEAVMRLAVAHDATGGAQS